MKFSLIFFSCEIKQTNNIYQFVLDVAKCADRNNFDNIWVPERHFSKFGGAFTNPPLMLSAIAANTKRLGLRAGSFISPLHHTVRAAENWSFVDNLSKGRIGISFGSGWNINDFIFFPERYEQRQAYMYSQIETIKDLWRGGKLIFKNTYNKPFEVTLCPKPFQPDLPIWITTSGHPETYKSAAKYDANILTHMINQDLVLLEERIHLYKQTLIDNNFDPNSKEITLMLHTYIDETEELIRNVTYKPFREYLREAVNLENQAAAGGGSISGGLKSKSQEIPVDLMEELLDITYEKYCKNASLIGTSDQCSKFIDKIKSIGVTEIASLIDFGLTGSNIMHSLNKLISIKENFKR